MQPSPETRLHLETPGFMPPNPPPWFYAAMEQQLQPVKQQLGRIERSLAIMYNHSCARGEARAFVMVPFLDGTNPTTIEINPLPLLSSAAIVENLQAQESKRYYRGYRGAGGAMPGDAARKAYILQAIGCGVI